jgi:hypothetical protein
MNIASNSARTMALATIFGSALWFSAQKAQAQDGTELRLNQIQVIGTHNSYHSGLPPSASKFWEARYPKYFVSRNYRHQSLTAQLNSGVRQIELDIFPDAKGGLFSHPSSELLIAQAGLPPDPPFDPNHVMDKPGFKVMHEQDADYRSNCQPFIACLQEVRKWSKAHPRHIPIFILVEGKTGHPNLGIPTVQPEPFTPEVFDALDREIRSVYSSSEMITPDQVRGSYTTLNQAVLAGHWPTLSDSRGKVMFLMDQKRVGPAYLAGHPSLKGRILFTNADPGDADAAFVEENEANAATIDEVAAKGYLVRTRADWGSTKSNARRDEVLASGAQMISTDYPASEPDSSGYSVRLPGDTVARCNPVTGDHSCEQLELKAAVK